jgi:hypothetical protein
MVVAEAALRNCRCGAWDETSGKPRLKHMNGSRSQDVVAILLVVAATVRADWALAQSATFYVNYEKSPDPERSYRTLDEAQQAVRQFLKEQKQQGDVTVLIEGGTYHLAKPLHFTPDDSPKVDGSSVIYKANPQATKAAVLSGGNSITGWQQVGNLWRAKVPAGWQFRELFVNGQRRPRARTPTTGHFRVNKAGSDNRTSFRFKPGDLRRFNKLTQAEIVFLHDWSISRIAIANIDEQHHTIHFAAPIGGKAPQFAISHFESHPRYTLENAPELLDSPGEWYLDADTNVLSYWPLAGETIDAAEVVAPRLQSLLVVQGDEATARPLRHLRFEGITFAHCAWPLPQGGFAESQATMHPTRHGDPNSPSELIPAAATFDAAESCSLEHCRFEHLGTTAVWFRRACKNNRFVKCRISDVAGNGVNVGQPHVQVPSQDAVAAGRALNPVSQGNALIFNRIERCGALYHGAVGVWVGMAKATQVSSNEIRDLPYTGVSVGWSWSKIPTVCEGNLISSNHIHHVMQLLSDGAGIYTLGRQPGTVLRGNVIHDVPANSGRAESNGIFMDEGSSEMLVENNIIYNVAKSPIRFHQAGKNTLRNNQLVTKRRTPPFRYDSTPDDIMAMDGNSIVEARRWTPPPGLLPATDGR